MAKEEICPTVEMPSAVVLRVIIEKIEKIEEDRACLSENIKIIVLDAKSKGYDPKRSRPFFANAK